MNPTRSEEYFSSSSLRTFTQLSFSLLHSPKFLPFETHNSAFKCLEGEIASVAQASSEFGAFGVYDKQGL
jgi:hypothetical protein